MKNRLSSHLAKLYFSAAMAVLTAVNVNAASTDVWQGGSSGSWLTAGNWTLGLPGTTDIAQFGTNGTATTIGISMSGATNNGANNEAVGAIDILSTRGAALTINNSSSTVGGTLTLNGATVTLNDSSTLADVILHNNSSKNLTLSNGSSQAMNVALGDATNNIISLEGSGNITINSNITEVNAGSKITITGGGTGVTTFAGTNSFSGGLVIQGNTLQVSSDANLGAALASNSITINGGTLLATTGFTMSANRDLLLGSTGALSVGSGQTLVYNGAIKDLSGNTGNFTKVGTGGVQLGGVSSYSGTTTINQGLVQLTSGNNRLPTATDVIMSTSSTSAKLDLNGFSQTINSISGGSNTSAAGAVALGAGTLTINPGSSTSATYSGAISGAGQLIKNGLGTQTLNGSSSYAGGTTINARYLVANHDGALGTGSVALTAAGVTLTLQNGAVNNYVSDNVNISIVSGSTVNMNFTGTSDTVGSLTIAGTLYTAAGTYGSTASGADNQFSEFIGLGEFVIVPEPSTWAMLLVGAGLMGWALRRRATQQS